LDKKIVKLNGGLGNQMFQFAFAYVLAKKIDAQILFDFSYFDESDCEAALIRNYELAAFNLECKAAQEEDLKLVNLSDCRSKVEKILGDIFKIKKFKSQKNIIRQSSAYKFDKKYFSPDKYYYEGYFQNENYFKDYKADLIKCFSIKEELDDKNSSTLKVIQSTESVSLHIRRGDYVTLQCVNEFHGLCSLEYYKEAIDYIAQNVKSPHFFLFSDDIDWVVQNLKIDYPYTVVNFNKEKGWFDLNLMKHCKHNIIANSSFSWWAAWLNENTDKIVISPKQWTTQKQKGYIAPKEWIKL
jgi:hypothetical protein